jgi:hypothetical protein
LALRAGTIATKNLKRDFTKKDGLTSILSDALILEVVGEIHLESDLGGLDQLKPPTSMP